MNKKEYLEKRNVMLGEAEKLLNEGKLDDYNAKEQEIKDLDVEFEKFAKAQTNINALKEKKVAKMIADGIEDSAFGVEKPKAKDIYGSVEYREAFMNYCQTGAMPDKFMNADEYTSTTDAGAVIPTTIMKEIIKEMKVYGQIFSRVRKTNIQGGMETPILSLKPVATWITEATVSDRKKVSASDKVTFTYFGLECRVAVSLLAEIVTLDMFESEITKLIVEAMVKAMDAAVISGTGSGQPTGITVDTRIPAGNKITLSSADFAKWEGWKKNVFAKIPLAYRAGGSFIMAAGTFEGHIDGMTDANGQPIGRVNYNVISNGVQERFGGREVMLVEDDIISPYDSASTGDVVAIFCKLSDYCVNSNMQMKMYRWLDQDTNQWVDKAILIADGKILDPNGVLIIKKGA